MPGYFDSDPRQLLPDDAASARVLVMSALGVTPYVDRAMEVLDRAERGDDPEFQAIVIARDATVAGLALFGWAPGSGAAMRLHSAVFASGVDVNDVGTRLIDAVLRLARAAGARALVAEMPDDPAIGAVLSLLRSRGFGEEARVPDFFGSDVALSLLRRQL